MVWVCYITQHLLSSSIIQPNLVVYDLCILYGWSFRWIRFWYVYALWIVKTKLFYFSCVGWLCTKHWALQPGINILSYYMSCSGVGSCDLTSNSNARHWPMTQLLLVTSPLTSSHPLSLALWGWGPSISVDHLISRGWH